MTRTLKTTRQGENKMKAEQWLKTLLDSFVPESEKDFRVLLSRRKTRCRRGTYIGRRKTIILYLKAFASHEELTGAALHELAHHLVWKRHEQKFRGLWHKNRRMPHHGREFKGMLDELLSAFNFVYRELLGGVITYDRRRPRRPPRFVPFEAHTKPPGSLGLGVPGAVFGERSGTRMP